jgi:hypothetical protein
MRGQNIYKELTKENGLIRKPRKGRNGSLVARRNECLVARYFYHASFRNLCYEDIVRVLVGEFFLSPSTIANLVLENSDWLQSMKQNYPSIYYFQVRWPHLKW